MKDKRDIYRGDMINGLSSLTKVELILMISALRNRIEDIDKRGLAYQKYCYNCNKVVK